MSQVQLEVSAVLSFPNAISGAIREVEAWLSSLVFIIPSASTSFLSWCTHHISDIESMIQKIEGRGRLWPGIKSAFLFLQSSQDVLSRAVRDPF